MASIYRFSFEHDIVPNGVTINSGSIWSGQGRMGINTNALTAVTRNTGSSVWAEIDVAVPTNTTGLRGSFYTKASNNFTYPAQLVKAGPYTLEMLSNSSSAILFNGTQVASQDVTYIEDNRWNLVRFSFDFNGAASTGSIEFNGIRLDAHLTDSTAGVSSVNLRGLAGSLSSLDDVGINDNSGSLLEDTQVPNAVMGFVGGLVDDGDIQNWQQNVASLFPINYIRKNQGNLTYIPSTDELICSLKSPPEQTLVQNVYTIIDANNHTEKVSFTTTSSFSIQTITYNDSDGLVYLIGKNDIGAGTTHYAYQTLDPITRATSSIVTWTGSFAIIPPVYTGNGSTTGYEYAFRDVLATTYCPMNSKIYSLVAVYNPYYPHQTDQNPTLRPDYLANKSWIQIVTLDPKTGKTELSYKYYGTWTHYVVSFQSAISTYLKPKSSMIWNPTDSTLYAWSTQFSGEAYSSNQLRSIEPESLTIKKNKAIYLLETGSLGSPTTDPQLGVDLVHCNINNTIYMATSRGTYDTTQIYRVDLTTRTGSLLFPFGIGNTVRKLVYSPARNAIFALGEVESFVFDPIKANYANDVRFQYGVTSSQWLDLCENGPLLSGSIIEGVPLFNIQDGVYVPKNSAVVAASYEKVYRLMGSMESSVINSLLSPDSLKAGATASGDICTLKIAKPTGSFTSTYKYEGFNIRIDNASSMNSASLLMGIRENGVNTALGAPVTTWANSTGSHIRSVFTRYNQGNQKWSGSQFDTVQFYMEAGNEL